MEMMMNRLNGLLPTSARSGLSRRPGFTLVEALLCVGIVGLLLGLVLAAVQSARVSAARLACGQRLGQIGLAFQMHHDSYHSLPPGTTHPELRTPTPYGPPVAPYPLLNWGARLLPFLEQEPLWAAITEAYAGGTTPADLGRFGMTPLKSFLCPSDPPLSLAPPLPHYVENSNFLGVAGRSSHRADGLLYLDSLVRLSQVTDGASNTLLVGERPANEFTRGGRWHGGWGNWGVADSYLGVRETATPNTCTDAPYPYRRGDKADPCSAFHFWSFHSGGANWLFADGSVRFLPYSADGVLPALSTRAGGEPSDG